MRCKGGARNFFHSFHLYHLTGKNASPAAKRKLFFRYLNKVLKTDAAEEGVKHSLFRRMLCPCSVSLFIASLFPPRYSTKISKIATMSA